MEATPHSRSGEREAAARLSWEGSRAASAEAPAPWPWPSLAPVQAHARVARVEGCEWQWGDVEDREAHPTTPRYSTSLVHATKFGEHHSREGMVTQHDPTHDWTQVQWE